jgi:hypothetical protein
MRVSEFYRLGAEQPSLDFVDVRLETDTPLFVDPTALNLLDTEWGTRCKSLVQDYFSLVLQCIHDGDHTRAQRLLAALNEPNETRLGYSSDRPRGHGMGKKLAETMWEALHDSGAVRSGIIHDLEDTALMIDGIASDVISDIVTNIIREPLLEYTKDMCERYGIPLVEGVASLPIWNSRTQQWETRHIQQPVVNGQRLLLVPKALVRKSITFQADNYYNLYLLTRLQEEAVSQGFVQLLRNGQSRPPSKKSLKEQYGEGKEQNRRLTPGREEVLEKYREDKRENPREPLSHEKFAETAETPEPDWEALLAALESVEPGRTDAHEYEVAVKNLFDAMFYPWLIYPTTQTRIHQGRKIIDITYMNMAQDDFFRWLADHYHAQFIIVECKNYTDDPANNEIDQLSGRFSPRRGQFGLLVCRSVSDQDTMQARCRDTANDERGFIVVLDDNDVRELIAAIRNAEPGAKLQMLRDKFQRLVM